MIGQILGNYRILKKLGEGGMGSVYLARDLSLEREVAIKIIAPELARNPGLMARFRIEAIAQAKLNHGNIVTIHTFDQEKDVYYIVMEHIDGQTLRAEIKEKGKFPAGRALQVFSQLLAGIAYAHAKGVVHRDIKPSNIFLTSTQIAKIGDFGIAKVEGIDGLTKVGTTLGSPVYSSPEQLLGKKVDGRTDIYSLGMTLYEMLIGSPPVKITGDGDYKSIKQALDMVPRNPSALNPAIPAPVDALVMKCIAKDPEQRFQSVKEVEDALNKVMGSLKPAAAAAVSPPPPKKKEAKDYGQKSPGKPFKFPLNKQQTALVLGLAAIVLLGAIFLLLSGGGSSTPPVQTGDRVQQTAIDQPGGSRPVSQMPRIVQPDNPAMGQQPGEQPGETPDSGITRPSGPSGTSVPSTTGTLPSITPGVTTDILTKMDRLIKNGHFQKAAVLGQDTVKNGTVTGDIYFMMAQAYYCDGKEEQARIYYMKALELNTYLTFHVGYRLEKDKIIDGTLGISRQNLYFNPSREGLRRYAFSIAMSQVKRVSLDMIADFGSMFKKKENRKAPRLILRDKQKNKYILLVKTAYDKSRSFAKDIIDTLRKM